MSTQTSVLDDALLSTLVPLGELPAEARAEMLKEARVVELAPGEFAFSEGDTDGDLVFLLAGRVQLFAGRALADSVQAGTDAARHAMSPATPREHSARARGATTLLRIDRAVLDTCLTWAQSAALASATEESAQGAADWIARLSSSPLFARIPPENIHKIATLLEPVRLREGDRVIDQGAPGDYYYVIQEGRCLVSRTVADGQREVPLAMLSVGDGFGEEALISGATRNASVTMASDGVLRRLTSESFGELIKKPLLRQVDRAQAKAMATDGARLLDVRLPQEYRRNAVKGAISLPLTVLRREMKALARDCRYVVYCDSGRRSAVAAFLLAQAGYDAYHLAGGILPDQAHATPPAGDRQPAAAPDSNQDADGRLSALTLRTVEAESLLEDAVRHKAETDAALRATEEEMARLRRSAASVNAGVLAEVEARLENDRQRLTAEATRTDESLAKAKSAVLALETARRDAEKEAAQARTQAEQAEAVMRQEAEARLHQGEQRLQAEYARACEHLETLRRVREQAQAELAAERARLEQSLNLANEEVARIEHERERALEARNVAQAALDAFAQAALARQEELAAEEQHLRSEAEGTLRAERSRLEEEFARDQEWVEQARQSRERARAARQTADDEAARAAIRARQEDERQRRETAERLQAQRVRLEQEAAEIQRQFEAALQAKEQAEAAQRDARERSERNRAAQAAGAHDAKAEARIASEIARREAEVARARKEIEAAHKAQMNVEVTRHIVDGTETGRSEQEITLRTRLVLDLDNWKSEEQRRAQDEQDAARAKDEYVRRINENADARKRAEQEAVDDMFRDIRSQLKEDED